MEIKALERALTYSKTVDDATALVVLKSALESFLRSQEKAYTASPKQQPQQSDKIDPGILKRMEDMIKAQPKGCPKCGAIGPHFCTGKKPGFVNLPYFEPKVGTGIEYLQNQPTAISNFDTNPRRDEILAQMGLTRFISDMLECRRPIAGGGVGVAPAGAVSGHGRDYYLREARNAHQRSSGSIGSSSSEI